MLKCRLDRYEKWDISTIIILWILHKIWRHCNVVVLDPQEKWDVGMFFGLSSSFWLTSSFRLCMKLGGVGMSFPLWIYTRSVDVATSSSFEMCLIDVAPKHMLEVRRPSFGCQFLQTFNIYLHCLAVIWRGGFDVHHPGCWVLVSFQR